MDRQTPLMDYSQYLARLQDFEAHDFCCTCMDIRDLPGMIFIEDIYEMACKAWTQKPDGWQGPMPLDQAALSDYDTIPPWRPTIRNILEEKDWQGVIEGRYVTLDMPRIWIRPLFEGVYKQYLLRIINLSGIFSVESLDSPLLPEHIRHLKDLLENCLINNRIGMRMREQDMSDSEEEEEEGIDRKELAKKGGLILEDIMNTDDQRLNEWDYITLYDILRDLSV